MTKAKTKSRRVWIVLDAAGKQYSEQHYTRRKDALDACLRSWYGAEIARATLTWTPSAKAKRRAKR